MKRYFFNKFKSTFRSIHLWIFVILIALLFSSFFLAPQLFKSNIAYTKGIGVKNDSINFIKKIFKPEIEPLDTVRSDELVNVLANNPPPKPPVTKIIKDPKTGVETTVVVEPKPAPPNIWPVKTVYPNPGAILPFKRIVAYYGNLYSKKMGALGEYPEDEMLTRLGAEVKNWELADPATPVVPALHYIAVVAQGSPGADGKYRARMPESEIDKVIAMAERIGAIVFLDLQVGFSTLEKEIPVFEKYFKMPQVHLGIDPEFSMKGGIRPGKVVGTYDAADINFAAEYLAKIVRENNLPPKILVVHRYTQNMMTNYKEIKPLPEVQVVII